MTRFEFQGLTRLPINKIYLLHVTIAACVVATYLAIFAFHSLP